MYQIFRERHKLFLSLLLNWQEQDPSLWKAILLYEIKLQCKLYSMTIVWKFAPTGAPPSITRRMYHHNRQLVTRL